MHATTKMANLAKFRQRFGENSRMSKGARWKVTSDENGKLGKMTNLAKIRQRFGENLKVFKGASWKVVILTKMANLAKMTNSPVWSHRHVYHFGQNRHYWREPFEHIIRSSVTSSTNFAEFATFQGAPLRSHLAYSYGVDEFLLCSPFSPNSAHSSKSPLSMGLFDLSLEYIV